MVEIKNLTRSKQNENMSNSSIEVDNKNLEEKQILNQDIENTANRINEIEQNKNQSYDNTYDNTFNNTFNNQNNTMSF